jgi:glycosyltransferase involved in cell wall biosynthesis
MENAEMTVYDDTLVSVIIPTFNCERYLAAALDSVTAQDYRPLEIIIVDDGSTDGTAAIAKDFFRSTRLPGHYHYQHNQGQAAARNHGLGLANGAWVAFLDADDLWLSGKTMRQLQIFAEYPHAAVVWGSAIAFAGDAPPASASEPSVVSPLWLLQSMLLRRQIFELTGPFDARLRMGEDVDWLLRAMEQGANCVIHEDLVVYYRRHGMNLTNDTNLTRQNFYAMLKRSLDRRRAQDTDHGESLPPLIRLPRQAESS